MHKYRKASATRSFLEHFYYSYVGKRLLHIIYQTLICNSTKVSKCKNEYLYLKKM